MYLNGLYVEKNEKEAFYIYMRCLETMTEEAANRIAGPVYLRLGKMFLNGTGIKKDLKSSLIAFQKAEMYLYDMVSAEDVMYKKSLKEAICGQEKAKDRQNNCRMMNGNLISENKKTRKKWMLSNQCQHPFQIVFLFMRLKFRPDIVLLFHRCHICTKFRSM